MERRHSVSLTGLALTAVAHQWLRDPARVAASVLGKRVVAWVLEALHLADGQRVLEIGTGTGYNAALLCHRLGDANVASIDIDPALVEQARQHLATLGYAPTLATGDGAAGLLDAAPYDAIIATAAVAHIPPAWIEQLRTGGVIVADLRGGFSGAMIRLYKIDDDTVEGRCHNYDAAFMPMRRELRYPLRQGASSPLVVDRRNPHRGSSYVAAATQPRRSRRHALKPPASSPSTRTYPLTAGSSPCRLASGCSSRLIGRRAAPPSASRARQQR